MPTADVESHFQFTHSAPASKAFLGILLGPSKGSGVALLGVTPGGGAELAGLAAGDMVTAVNGVAIAGSAGNIGKSRDGVAPRDDVVVDFQRAGQPQSVTVTTQTPGLHGLMPNMDFDIAIDAAANAVRGLDIVDLNADLASYFGVNGGVLILQAPPTSNLRSGDVVLAVGGIAPADAKDVNQRVAQASGTTDWVVRRQGAEQTVSVDAKELAAGQFTGGPQFKRVIRMHRDGAGSDAQVEEIELEAP